MSAVVFGSVSEVATAITAVGALIAAIIGARQAARLFRIESSRDAAAAERETQSQASKVFAWVATQVDDEDTVKSYGAVIVNSSEQAIYDVRVRVLDHTGEERSPIVLTLLPPGSYYLAERPDNIAWEFASRLRSYDDEIRPVTKSKKRRIEALEFRDSNNVRWARDRNGMLTRDR